MRGVFCQLITIGELRAAWNEQKGIHAALMWTRKLHVLHLSAYLFSLSVWVYGDDLWLRKRRFLIVYPQKKTSYVSNACVKPLSENQL